MHAVDDESAIRFGYAACPLATFDLNNRNPERDAKC